jgi:hypothetical protein
MAREELEAQRKDELIEVILAQSEQIGQLQAAFRQLQADHEALKLRFEQNQKKPPTMSKNSSQPPSKDQKGNKPKDRRKRRHGPPPELMGEAKVPAGFTLVNLEAWNDHPLVIQAIKDKIQSAQNMGSQYKEPILWLGIEA